MASAALDLWVAIVYSVPPLSCLSLCAFLSLTVIAGEPKTVNKPMGLDFSEGKC